MFWWLRKSALWLLDNDLGVLYQPRDHRRWHCHLPLWMVSLTDSFQPPNKLWRAPHRHFLTPLFTSLASLYDGSESQIPTKTQGTTFHVPLLSSPSRRAAHPNLATRDIHSGAEYRERAWLLLYTRQREVSLPHTCSRSNLRMSRIAPI